MDKNPLKGEIWLVNFEPAREGELGKQKRPSIIFQANDASEIIDTITLIPLSSDTDQYNEIHILLKPSKLNGLTKLSAAICSHIYTVNKKRLIKNIGRLNNQELESISRGVILHLDIDLD
ncbi:MAG: hypothetical protein A3I68_07490 [Candidatus Melainabacteria bacterium RIFCSPLOWO2_02_FULL_35_15]|nr:MAG: hypothetical protein A3I68_07490 [Candidatus Melainabacteria bacterium RIFCSPLOWO2_02_FULL_35_15]